MSNEDMIRELKNVADEYRDKVVHTGEVNITLMCEEVAKRLEELSQPKTDWIPCEERLPEECIEVLVTIKEKEGGCYTLTTWLQEGEWVIRKSKFNPTVIAWQPLPAPYKKEGETDD